MEKPEEYPGELTELIAQLHGVAPTDSYETVRRLCRKAAKKLRALRDELTTLEDYLDQRTTEKRQGHSS